MKVEEGEGEGGALRLQHDPRINKQNNTLKKIQTTQKHKNIKTRNQCVSAWNQGPGSTPMGSSTASRTILKVSGGCAVVLLTFSMSNMRSLD